MKNNDEKPRAEAPQSQPRVYAVINWRKQVIHNPAPAEQEAILVEAQARLDETVSPIQRQWSAPELGRNKLKTKETSEPLKG